MPHDYSMEIHKFLNEKLTLLEQEEKKITEIDNSNMKAAYLAGQRSEIVWLRDYFQENTDLKNHKYY